MVDTAVYRKVDIKRILKSKPLLLFLAFAVPFIVYSGCIGGNFVYDDNVFILQNPLVRDISKIPYVFTSSVTTFLNNTPANYYRPVYYLVYMAEYQVFGMNPWGWHLVNLTLHSMNAVMVFLLASFFMGEGPIDGIRAGGDNGPLGPPIAFFAALVFALHPINSEVVSWVGAIPELVYTLFLLIAFYLYIRAGEAGQKRVLRYVISVFCFFIALLSKETAMALIIIIPLYEMTMRGRGFIRRWKVMLPYFLTAFVYMLVRTYALGWVMQGKEIDLTKYEALINVFPLIARYMGKLLVPVNLSAIYTYDIAHSIAEPMVIVGFLAASAIAVVLFILRGKRTVFFFFCWIFVPLLPVLYIPAISVGGFADRYLYLSTVGFGIIIGAVALRFISTPVKSGARGGERSRKVTIAVAAVALCLLAIYAAVSVDRVLVWRNDYNLWSDTVTKSPGSANAHYNLGWALHRMAMYDGAEAEYKKALTLAPDKEDAHYNLALIYNDKGDYTGAIKHFKESIRLRPGSYRAYYNLALVYQKMGKVSDAIVLYNIALKLNPANDDIHYNLAWAYQDTGDYPNALDHYKEVVRLNPDSADAYYNMGIIYEKLGLPGRAAQGFSAALRIDPDYSVARLELNRIMLLKNKDK